MTTTCLKVASRPTTASYWPPWTAPGAQSCTDTSVTWAPSPDEHGDAAGVPGQAGVVEDDRRLRERADLDDELAPHDLVRAGAGQAERDRPVQLRLGGHADDGGTAAALPGERGEPVGRLGQALEQRVVGLDAW